MSKGTRKKVLYIGKVTATILCYYANIEIAEEKKFYKINHIFGPILY